MCIAHFISIKLLKPLQSIPKIHFSKFTAVIHLMQIINSLHPLEVLIHVHFCIFFKKIVLLSNKLFEVKMTRFLLEGKEQKVGRH
ncbi:hypothetical protein GDO78_003135 [Eleutherodactylus coqui]|uniref:Uncharacterized protein n=1 Tax=Eleutherodactylus coqui TaxID=57060 RepID=A0A8J6K209_ELECQ|nr:hypothetical protein GDO78_003135 [Eleutherodactylus coqui]